MQEVGRILVFTGGFVARSSDSMQLIEEEDGPEYMYPLSGILIYGYVESVGE